MFSSDDVRNRCKTVYARQVDRHKERLEKAAGCKLDIPRNRILPYGFQQFFDWTWYKYGADVHKCPWCAQPIDFRTMHFDHVVPLDRGGSMGLDNLDGICKGCNELKSTQSVEEFRHLLQFLETCTPSHRKFIEHKIRAGAVANRMRFYPRQKKEGGKEKQPKPLAIQTTLNMDDPPTRPF